MISDKVIDEYMEKVIGGGEKDIFNEHNEALKDWRKKNEALGFVKAPVPQEDFEKMMKEEENAWERYQSAVKKLKKALEEEDPP